MGVDADLSSSLIDQVRRGKPLRLVGGNTRAFLGRPVEGETLALAGHGGIIDYDPKELVITARAGTRVSDLEALLAAQGQMLAFEPPVFGPSGTIGGMVATGLSGPRRPFAGAMRDYVLGARILDGRGDILRFGGTVFKNVAGFDAFRLMVGAQGALGIILDVSLRVVPIPRAETTLAFELDSPTARAWVARLMGKPGPLSGAVHDGNRLFLRISGGGASVSEARQSLGGEPQGDEVWTQFRNLTHPNFRKSSGLWRLSVPQTVPLPTLPGQITWDWGGSQVWLATDDEGLDVWSLAQSVGGHATLYRWPRMAVFQPLPPAMLALHRRIKAALDPKGLFNPGRLYEDL